MRIGGTKSIPTTFIPVVKIAVSTRINYKGKCSLELVITVVHTIIALVAEARVELALLLLAYTGGGLNIRNLDQVLWEFQAHSIPGCWMLL